MYVYNNYLIKDKIKRYEGKLMSEVLELQEKAKTILEMYK